MGYQIVNYLLSKQDVKHTVTKNVNNVYLAQIYRKKKQLNKLKLVVR